MTWESPLVDCAGLSNSDVPSCGCAIKKNHLKDLKSILNYLLKERINKCVIPTKS